MIQTFASLRLCVFALNCLVRFYLHDFVKSLATRLRSPTRELVGSIPGADGVTQTTSEVNLVTGEGKECSPKRAGV